MFTTEIDCSRHIESNELLFKGLAYGTFQSHCAKMREGICTQAELHTVHLQKQGGERQHKASSKGGTRPQCCTHEAPDTLIKYLRWLLHNKGGPQFNQTVSLDFLSPQLPGVHTILSTDNTVNCYSFVRMHLQSLVACSSMTKTKLVSRASPLLCTSVRKWAGLRD